MDNARAAYREHYDRSRRVRRPSEKDEQATTSTAVARELLETLIDDEDATVALRNFFTKLKETEPTGHLRSVLTDKQGSRIKQGGYLTEGELVRLITDLSKLARTR